MAGGTLGSPPLSVNDINVAFYGVSNTKSLSGLAGDARLSLPVAITDFTGIPYCTVCANPLSLTWTYNNSVNKTVSILTVPYKDFQIYCVPPWASAAEDSANCCINMSPTTDNSVATRTGRVCVCSLTGLYDTTYICMTQFSNQI